jgi:hypothetical protein
MSLGAGQAFPHSTIVANKDFFSHANLVSTREIGLCQALSAGWNPGQPSRFRKRQKKSTNRSKKACLPKAELYNRHQSRILQVFIMKLMITAKRVLFLLLTVSGVALYAAGTSQNGPCPLPVNDAEYSASSENAQSPEKAPCMRVVMHNGMPICLPCPAADAHTRVHGDADLGPCDKPGNQK